MGLIKKQIGKGISLNYLETDKFKTGYMSVNLIAPLCTETAAKNALIPSILMRGSVKYPNMAEINKKLDYLYATSLGSRNSKRGECQVFGLCGSMIDSAYTLEGENLLFDVIDVMADILLSPVTEDGAFNKAYTESEKRNLIDYINGQINNKGVYARNRCISEMCRGERFGLFETGTVAEVEACTAKSVYEQYKYALACYPIEIFFVGKCDINSLADKLTSVFSDIDRAPIAVPETEIVRRAAEVKHINEDMPVNQGKLNMGFRTGIALSDSDYPALLMFNELFGGGTTSKLFMNVREKMSLCYYCSSHPDSAKGILMVSSGIEVANRDIAEGAILDQLEAMRAGDFTAEDEASARLSLINSYNELADSARGLEAWYLGRIREGIGGDPCDVAAAIERVTREEIIAAANKISLDTVYFLNGTLKSEDVRGA